MGRNFESILFKGFVDKSLRLTYVYMLELAGKFQSIKESEDGGRITTSPSYIITLSTLNPRTRVTISSTKYFTFVVLFEKSLKLIQENLFELFPNVGKIEFDVDERVLERFQTEKALSSADITMTPTVHVDQMGQCSPGLRISLDDKDGEITIPLEDAIGINQMLKIFDPNQYGLTILSQLIKIE